MWYKFDGYGKFVNPLETDASKTFQDVMRLY